ncbi:hypothetical protein TNCV_1109281 [Trichonephila clavipes]|nr:hypothetical protein TNCV_1109281 [Trichonephila clavipes]
MTHLFQRLSILLFHLTHDRASHMWTGWPTVVKRKCRELYSMLRRDMLISSPSMRFSTCGILSQENQGAACELNQKLRGFERVLPKRSKTDYIENNRRSLLGICEKDVKRENKLCCTILVDFRRYDIQWNEPKR